MPSWNALKSLPVPILRVSLSAQAAVNVKVELPSPVVFIPTPPVKTKSAEPDVKPVVAPSSDLIDIPVISPSAGTLAFTILLFESRPKLPPLAIVPALISSK